MGRTVKVTSAEVMAAQTLVRLAEERGETADIKTLKIAGASTPGSETKLSQTMAVQVADSPSTEPRASVLDGDAQLNDLISDAQTGDQAALTSLLKRSIPRVEELCRRIMVGRPQWEVEDAVQETLLQLIRRLPNLSFESVSFDSFVLKLARRIALNHPRKDRFASGAEMPNAIKTEETPPLAIRTLLDELPQSERQVLFLMGIGLSTREIADILGTSAATVLTRSERALGNLRPRLSQIQSDV